MSCKPNICQMRTETSSVSSPDNSFRLRGEGGEGGGEEEGMIGFRYQLKTKERIVLHFENCSAK